MCIRDSQYPPVCDRVPGDTLSGLGGVASRRGGLGHDQGLGTVQRPTSHTVPTERLESGELVDDRTANRVELLRDSLSKSLLTGEVRVEHTRLGRTSTS